MNSNILLCIVLALGLLLIAFGARGHEPYSGWRQPDQPHMICCNGADCRPTRAFVDDDGRWRAWDGRAWLIIPRGKLLPADKAGDGRNHLCSTPAGAVYCFSPAQPKG